VNPVKTYTNYEGLWTPVGRVIYFEHNQVPFCEIVVKIYGPNSWIKQTRPSMLCVIYK
jgi:hypothetical protein